MIKNERPFSVTDEQGAIVSMASQEFAGKRALVTGGASGIGYAIAQGFCEQGAHVTIADISENNVSDALEELTSANATTVNGQVCDVSQTDSVERMMREVGPGLDVLVCAAGIFAPGTADETSDETWAKVIGVNLTGTFLCARAAIPLMRPTGGAIVTISSSTGAHDAIPGAVAYVTSKGGVAMMTKAMAVDYAAENIRVNAIAPGPTDTPMLRGLMDEPARDAFAATLPVRRLGTPQEFVGAALFLAGDAASFVTGAVLAIDGGQTALV